MYLQKVYNSDNKLIIIQERSKDNLSNGLGMSWYKNGSICRIRHSYGGGHYLDEIEYDPDGKIERWIYGDGYNVRGGQIYRSRDNDTLIRRVDCGEWPESEIPRQWDLTAPVFTRAYWETKTIDDHNTYIKDCPPNKILFERLFSN